jgi:hypothetical protein
MPSEESILEWCLVYPPFVKKKNISFLRNIRTCLLNLTACYLQKPATLQNTVNSCSSFVLSWLHTVYL